MKKAITQTLVIKHTIGSDKKPRKLQVLRGDQVDRIQRSPSQSYNGIDSYNTARLITSNDRKRDWYKNLQWDENGNSDWIQ
jgi:hypothetical protein